MKSKVLSAVIATLVMAGCSREPTPEEKRLMDEFDAEVNQNIKDANTLRLAQDKEDAIAIRKELEAQGQTVKDVYFYDDDDGNRQVSIVTENDDGSFMESVGSMTLGLAAGMMVANMLSGSSAFNSSTMSRTRYYSDYKEKREKRRSSYVSSIMAHNRMSAYKSVGGGSKYASLRSSGMISRTSGAIGARSAARSSSMSASRGG